MNATTWLWILDYTFALSRFAFRFEISCICMERLPEIFHDFVVLTLTNGDFLYHFTFYIFSLFFFYFF